MGSLIRQIMREESRDTFFEQLIFDKEMLPELILLGTLEHRQIPTDDGKVYALDIIHYEGKQYVVKGEYITRWFDKR